MKHLSHNPDQTREIAVLLAEQFVKKYGSKPLVIALEGELGAGKTTFVQAFAGALGIKNIKSPTFVLMKNYPIENWKLEIENCGYSRLYHLDCYRLQSPKDLEPLGVEDVLNKKENIVLIEWAERVRGILPKDHIKIEFKHIDENTREISIN